MLVHVDEAFETLRLMKLYIDPLRYRRASEYEAQAQITEKHG